VYRLVTTRGKKGESTDMSLPSLSPTSSGLVESMTLAQATRLLASCSEHTRFTVLVNRIDDPINARVTSNGLMLRVDQDDLKILICGILINPVRVEDSQICTATSHPLLSCRFQRPLVFKLIYTLVGRFSCDHNSSVTVPAQNSQHKM
jgi:hypothetical protein